MTYTKRLMHQFTMAEDDIRHIIFQQVLDYIGEKKVKEIFKAHDMDRYEED